MSELGQSLPSDGGTSIPSALAAGGLKPHEVASLGTRFPFLLGPSPPHPQGGNESTSDGVSSTKATTTIAPKIMSCPRTNVGRSAALIALLLGGVESSIGSPRTRHGTQDL